MVTERNVFELTTHINDEREIHHKPVYSFRIKYFLCVLKLNLGLTQSV